MRYNNDRQSLDTNQEKDYPIWYLVVIGVCFVVLLALSLTGGM